VGKGENNGIVIDQVITRHTKLNPKNVSMETYLLRVQQFTVQQVGKGNNLIAIDQVITHHTKVNTKNVQTCPFNGNLQTESAPVHSTESGERRKQFDRY